MKPDISAVQEIPFDDHLILFHPLSNNLVALNTTGRFIWEHHAKGLDSRDIADRLTSSFTVSPEQALHDVEAYLSDWRETLFFETPSQPDTGSFQKISKDFSSKISELPESIHWHSSLCFQLGGRFIRIEFGDAELQEILFPILQHLQVSGVDSCDRQYRIWQHDGKFHVAVGGGAIHSTGSKHEAVGRILYDLVAQFFDSNDYMAVLHGGAVRHGDSAIILPGSKGSGKSTLIAALQHDGYEFLSDDICLLEKNEGQLMPMPMCQRLKSGSWEVLGSLYPAINNLPAHSIYDCEVKFLPPATGGQVSWDSSWPVTGLVFPQYRPGKTSVMKRIKPIETLSLLMDSDGLGNDCISSLLSWLENMPAFIIRYSNLSEAREHFSAIAEEL